MPDVNVSGEGNRLAVICSDTKDYSIIHLIHSFIYLFILLHNYIVYKIISCYAARLVLPLGYFDNIVGTCKPG